MVLGLIAALALVTSAFAGMNVLEYKDGDLGKVTFDGKLHNTKLGAGKCMECHKGNVPFAMKKPGTEGSVKITKADHVAGKYCGTCHDGNKEVGGAKVFGWQEGSDCTKCHMKEEMKKEGEKIEEMKPEEVKPEEKIPEEMKPEVKPEEKK
jgi:c(7)-type cytochrome triheme protein